MNRRESESRPETRTPVVKPVSIFLAHKKPVFLYSHSSRMQAPAAAKADKTRFMLLRKPFHAKGCFIHCPGIAAQLAA